MKRSKRWNGQMETLEAEFLRDVIMQMTAYGEQVQFNLTGTTAAPSYRVVNAAGKAIAFDCKSHLLRPAEDEFEGKNATRLFTLDQIKALSVAPKRAASVERVRRTGTTGERKVATPRVTAEDQINNDKYTYFKSNRATLPEGIQEHSQDISKLMRGGMSVEAAFAEIVKLHY